MTVKNQLQILAISFYSRLLWCKIVHLILGLLIITLALGLGLPATLAESDDLVVLETQLGTITVELFDEDAPAHAENFRILADSGSYNSTLFHRIIPGFMIQGGDPNTIDGDPSTWGQGGPSGSVPAEFNDIRHERGILSMARSSDPNSAGSQFFIVHQPSSFLDEEYTVFGRIVTAESFEVLDKIIALETESPDRPIDIESARVHTAYTTPRSQVDQLLDQDPVLRLSTPVNSDTMDSDTPPSLTPNIVDGVYINKKLDVTFIPPVGWSVSEPPKSRPNIPDVAVVKTNSGALPSVITLTIEYAQERDVQTFADERLAIYESAIELGTLVIDSSENEIVAGNDAVVIKATGTLGTAEAETSVKYREVLFAKVDKLYSFTYLATADDFDSNLDKFDMILDSFDLASSMSTMDSKSNTDDGGCLIATAAYGTEMAEQVQLLREIRDNTLMSTSAGSAFMAEFNNIYYTFSPTVADWERQSPEFRTLVRTLITPMITSLSIMSLNDTGSEDLTILLGSLVIAINVGIYVGAPTVLAWRIKR